MLFAACGGLFLSLIFALGLDKTTQDTTTQVHSGELLEKRKTENGKKAKRKKEDKQVLPYMFQKSFIRGSTVTRLNQQTTE
jgi:hypothetical protein